MLGKLFRDVFKPKTTSKFTLESLSKTCKTITNYELEPSNQQELINQIEILSTIMIWADANEEQSFWDIFFNFDMFHKLVNIFFKIFDEEGKTQKEYELLQIALLKIFQVFIVNIRKTEQFIFYIYSNHHLSNLIEFLSVQYGGGIQLLYRSTDNHADSIEESLGKSSLISKTRKESINEEIIAYYISLLKIITLKLTETTVELFLDEKAIYFPLYTDILKFYNNGDTQVRTAVRVAALHNFTLANSNEAVKSCIFKHPDTYCYLYNILIDLRCQMTFLNEHLMEYQQQYPPANLKKKRVLVKRKHSHNKRVVIKRDKKYTDFHRVMIRMKNEYMNFLTGLEYIIDILEKTSETPMMTVIIDQLSESVMEMLIHSLEVGFDVKKLVTPQVSNVINSMLETQETLDQRMESILKLYENVDNANAPTLPMFSNSHSDESLVSNQIKREFVNQQYTSYFVHQSMFHIKFEHSCIILPHFALTVFSEFLTFIAPHAHEQYHSPSFKLLHERFYKQSPWIDALKKYVLVNFQPPPHPLQMMEADTKLNHSTPKYIPSPQHPEMYHSCLFFVYKVLKLKDCSWIYSQKDLVELFESFCKTLVNYLPNRLATLHLLFRVFELLIPKISIEKWTKLYPASLSIINQAISSFILRIINHIGFDIYYIVVKENLAFDYLCKQRSLPDQVQNLLLLGSYPEENWFCTYKTGEEEVRYNIHAFLVLNKLHGMFVEKRPSSFPISDTFKSMMSKNAFKWKNLANTEPPHHDQTYVGLKDRYVKCTVLFKDDDGKMIYERRFLFFDSGFLFTIVHSKKKGYAKIRSITPLYHCRVTVRKVTILHIKIRQNFRSYETVSSKEFEHHSPHVYLCFENEDNLKKMEDRIIEEIADCRQVKNEKLREYYNLKLEAHVGQL